MKFLLLIVLVCSNAFAQLNPRLYKKGSGNITCIDGGAFVKVSGFTTGCYHPGRAYISKLEVIEIKNKWDEVRGRIYSKGITGKAIIEADELGYYYTCSNPRGTLFSKYIEFPLPNGKWDIEIEGNHYAVENDSGCKIKNM